MKHLAEGRLPTDAMVLTIQDPEIRKAFLRGDQ
jgi:hypothetical protein